MPKKSGKRDRLISAYKFGKETRRLKAELRTHLSGVLKRSAKPSAPSSISHGECILELVSMGSRAAGAICDIPVLNVLKPVVGVTTLICDTVKCVKGNREAALDLAAHANAVAKCIVDRAAGLGNTSDALDKEALAFFRLALENVHSYLTILKKPRGRLTSWVFANAERDRFARLNSALDKALALFSSTEIVSVA
ncbi:hypothetical protein DFH07DRAFT_57395 [Mycena maculata]|uniref:Uncharacterized protein n=1 Tax=Mycena maculata TaxID=230809 RepID=A0AAD7IEQ8_9AGAR|nr:hypothetical protein DFH07DRAFT_57395 [Mycena maculata]